MSKYALLIDYQYCTGCHACEVSCRNEHGIPADEWGIVVTAHGPTQLDGKWFWNYVPVPSDLCDLCEARREAGKKAACELHCLAQCISIVPVEEALKTMDGTSGSMVCFTR